MKLLQSEFDELYSSHHTGLGKFVHKDDYKFVEDQLVSEQPNPDLNIGANLL